MQPNGRLPLPEGLARQQGGSQHHPRAPLAVVLAADVGLSVPEVHDKLASPPLRSGIGKAVVQGAGMNKIVFRSPPVGVKNKPNPAEFAWV